MKELPKGAGRERALLLLRSRDGQGVSAGPQQYPTRPNTSTLTGFQTLALVALAAENSKLECLSAQPSVAEARPSLASTLSIVEDPAGEITLRRAQSPCRQKVKTALERLATLIGTHEAFTKYNSINGDFGSAYIQLDEFFLRR